MRIISGVVPGVSRLAGLQVELSKKARQRLKWFDPLGNLTGLITTIPIVAMPVSPAAILTSAPRLFTAGRDATTPST